MFNASYFRSFIVLGLSSLLSSPIRGMDTIGRQDKVDTERTLEPLLVNMICKLLQDESSLDTIIRTFAQLDEEIPRIEALRQVERVRDLFIARIDNEDVWPKTLILKENTIYVDHTEKRIIDSLKVLNSYEMLATATTESENGSPDISGLRQRNNAESNAAQQDSSRSIGELPRHMQIHNIGQFISIITALSMLKQRLDDSYCAMCKHSCTKERDKNVLSVGLACGHRHHVGCLAPAFKEKHAFCPACKTAVGLDKTLLFGLDSVPTRNDIEALALLAGQDLEAEQRISPGIGAKVKNALFADVRATGILCLVLWALTSQIGRTLQLNYFLSYSIKMTFLAGALYFMVARLIEIFR